jgi:hypothetical protein
LNGVPPKCNREEASHNNSQGDVVPRRGAKYGAKDRWESNQMGAEEQELQSIDLRDGGQEKLDARADGDAGMAPGDAEPHVGALQSLTARGGQQQEIETDGGQGQERLVLTIHYRPQREHGLFVKEFCVILAYSSEFIMTGWYKKAVDKITKALPAEATHYAPINNFSYQDTGHLKIVDDDITYLALERFGRTRQNDVHVTLLLNSQPTTQEVVGGDSNNSTTSSRAHGAASGSAVAGSRQANDREKAVTSPSRIDDDTMKLVISYQSPDTETTPFTVFLAYGLNYDMALEKIRQCLPANAQHYVPVTDFSYNLYDDDDALKRVYDNIGYGLLEEFSRLHNHAVKVQLNRLDALQLARRWGAQKHANVFDILKQNTLDAA